MTIRQFQRKITFAVAKRLRIRSRIGVVVAVLAAATGACTINSSAAMAYCSSAACNGKDPHATACDQDAKPLDSFRYGNFFVELRYSPRCYAAWTRISGGNPNQGCIGGWTARNMGVIEGSPAGVGPYYICAQGYTYYTQMIDFHRWVRSCYLIDGDFNNQPPTGNRACTGWH